MKSFFLYGNAQKNQLGIKFKKNRYDFDYENFDIINNNSTYSTIVGLIEKDSTVLDIGCASGNIGYLLKKYKNCIIDGVDIDEVALKKANSKKVYDNLLNMKNAKSFKECLKKNNINRKYDYIVLADVLEHLENPDDVIIDISKLLNRSGKIIISLPNICHIDIIKSLIDGKFNYNESGLLDSTHLRFYTETSFVELIDNISSNHGIYFSIDLKNRIYIKPDYVGNEKIYELINGKNTNGIYYTLQNVFVLTLENRKDKVKRYKSTVVSNNFDYIISEYENQINYLEKLKKECEQKTKILDESNDKIKILEEKNEQKNRMLDESNDKIRILEEKNEQKNRMLDESNDKIRILEEKIKQTIKHDEEVTNYYYKLDEQLKNIKNSKRWKTIEFIAKVFRR